MRLLSLRDIASFPGACCFISVRVGHCLIFLALLELCTLEGLKYERANLTLRQLHAISSSAKHDMNNKSFNIQGHMDLVKICILFQEVDSLEPAF